MKKSRSRIALAVAVIVVVLLSPAVAMANPFSMDWSILGFDPTPPQYWNAYIDGSNIFYTVTSGVPLWRYDLVTATHHALPATAGANAWGLVGAGDWAAWTERSNITAMNLKTGTIRHVTNEPDYHFDQDSFLSISDADGVYAVWQWRQDNDTNVTAIKAKNLGINGSVFTLVGSSSNPARPSVYGKRVAYVADWNGSGNVFVKTIGSNAPPSRISSCGAGNYLSQESVNIGSHLVVWNEFDNDVGNRLHYYDFYTGETHEMVPGGTWVFRLSVSGDRIFYLGGTDTTHARVFDTRVAKSTPALASVDVSTEDTIHDGTIDGNRIAYVDAGTRGMHYAVLTAPSFSLHSVPSRISHGGHIHLTGYVSDQGRRIAGARIGIEKYSSGKWVLVKTLTATSTGDFTYKTSKTYSKTKYRVVYDGYMSATAAPARNHLSTVSAVKTAWPR